MLLIAGTANAQTDTLPYYQIPDAPSTYTAATVSARMIDGLGYRYYWATESLRPEDLAYEPGNDGKSCAEVLDHLLGLTRFILVAIKQEDSKSKVYPTDLTWEQKRAETLNNIKEASDIFRSTGDVAPYEIVFRRGEQESRLPFWNVINGPIEDAIYHAGQIVSYRRSSGNPSNPNVNVLRGKTRE